MRDGATKGFVQGYNAQIAVDGEAQIIVATTVTQAANDNGQLVPTLLEVADNLGRLPDAALADAGYFSEANATDPALASVDLYTPPNRREKRADTEGTGTGTPAGPAAQTMR